MCKKESRQFFYLDFLYIRELAFFTPFAAFLTLFYYILTGDEFSTLNYLRNCWKFSGKQIV